MYLFIFLLYYAGPIIVCYQNKIFITFFWSYGLKFEIYLNCEANFVFLWEP